MKVCESLATFDSPDLINPAFESSTGIQRAAKLENEDFLPNTEGDVALGAPLGSPPGGLERTVRSKNRRLLPARAAPSIILARRPICVGSWFCFFHTKETCVA